MSCDYVLKTGCQIGDNLPQRCWRRAAGCHRRSLKANHIGNIRKGSWAWLNGCGNRQVESGRKLTGKGIFRELNCPTPSCKKFLTVFKIKREQAGE